MEPLAQPLQNVSSSPEPLPARCRAVVCGTLYRKVEQLRADYRALEVAGAAILSPVDLRFTTDREGFLLATHEVGDTSDVVRERHLTALRRADLVWLHAPEGYVGASAALELGIAEALDIPVYARRVPSDVALAHAAQVVDEPGDAVLRIEELGDRGPGRPLELLQEYYDRAAIARGEMRESPRDTMLRVSEAVGELSRAVRRADGPGEAGAVYADEDAANELADLQLCLLRLASTLDVRLGAAVSAKERRRRARHQLRVA